MDVLLEKQQHEKRLERHVADLPDYIQEYVTAQRRHERSPSTLLGYVYEYKHFFQWLISEGIAEDITDIKDIPLTLLEKLKKEDMELFIDRLKNENIQASEKQSKKRSRMTVNRTIMALNSLFNYLTTETENEDGECYFYRNVMSKIKVVRSNVSANSRANSISADIYHNEDIPRFIHFMKNEYQTTVKAKALESFMRNKERDVAIISFFLGSGVRVSELAGMTLSNINFRTGKVKLIRKGNKTDTIDILPEAMEDLKAYLNVRSERYGATDKDVYVFLTKYKGMVKPMSIRAIQNLVEKYTKAFNQGGEGLSPHKLRHTFAGDYLKNGDGNIVLLRDQLGHNSIETTALYTNLDERERKKVIQRMEENRKQLEE